MMKKINKIRSWKLFFIIIVLFSVSALFFACDESTNDDEDFNEEVDNPIGKKNDDAADFDELDRKMREIMNDNTESDKGPVKEVRIINAKGAKNVDVNLTIGAGKLRLTGGASELLIAGFIYSNPLWKPEINYNLDGNSGNLSIEQPEKDEYKINNDDKYVWNLKFNNKIPLDFNIELGAGVSEIFLGDLNINDFSMVLGVGKSQIDLRGKWNKSTTIHLVGGIGLSQIYLPQNIGVELNVDRGFGAMDLNNLIQKSRTQYVNKLYETSDVILTVNLKSGIGKIDVD
jgi:hypothetical protein